jgi:metal-dependent HD superfamily phosphatase/phosphodiesterase
MKSPKELSLDKKIMAQAETLLSPEIKSDDWLPKKALAALMADKDLEAAQNYANAVSLVRLSYNDHGPVHMRMVTLNALKMLELFKEGGVKMSLESENAGTFDDSVMAVCLAAFMHDLGMSVVRQDHELFSITLALPFINKILDAVFDGEANAHQAASRKAVIRSCAIEGIAGHMATRKVHSLEAGLILAADGCDMAKGRARIPMALSTEAKQGDIHKYSANSIERVTIEKGEEKPVCIHITMSSDVGFFQVEEVLIPKLNMSPAKRYIELAARVKSAEPKWYF